MSPRNPVKARLSFWQGLRRAFQGALFLHAKFPVKAELSLPLNSSTGKAMTSSNDSTTPRIDNDDAAALARWTRELNVTEAQLGQAIAKVGNKAADVELYLKGSRSSTNADTADKAGA